LCKTSSAAAVRRGYNAGNGTDRSADRRGRLAAPGPPPAAAQWLPPFLRDQPAADRTLAGIIGFVANLERPGSSRPENAPGAINRFVILCPISIRRLH